MNIFSGVSNTDVNTHLLKIISISKALVAMRVDIQRVSELILPSSTVRSTDVASKINLQE